MNNNSSWLNNPILIWLWYENAKKHSICGIERQYKEMVSKSIDKQT